MHACHPHTCLKFKLSCTIPTYISVPLLLVLSLTAWTLLDANSKLHTVHNMKLSWWEILRLCGKSLCHHEKFEVACDGTKDYVCNGNICLEIFAGYENPQKFPTMKVSCYIYGIRNILSKVFLNKPTSLARCIAT